MTLTGGSPSSWTWIWRIRQFSFILRDGRTSLTSITLSLRLTLPSFDQKLKALQGQCSMGFQSETMNSSLRRQSKESWFTRIKSTGILKRISTPGKMGGRWPSLFGVSFSTSSMRWFAMVIRWKHRSSWSSSQSSLSFSTCGWSTLILTTCSYLTHAYKILI